MAAWTAIGTAGTFVICQRFMSVLEIDTEYGIPNITVVVCLWYFVC